MYISSVFVLIVYLHFVSFAFVFEFAFVNLDVLFAVAYEICNFHFFYNICKYFHGLWRNKYCNFLLKINLGLFLSFYVFKVIKKFLKN